VELRRSEQALASYQARPVVCTGVVDDFKGKEFMVTKNPHDATLANHRRIESLLFPLAMFLRVGGLARKDAERIFSAAYRRASSKAREVKVEYIGHPTPYADIMGLWTNDKRFVNSNGRPLPLKATGKRSMATIVREACPTANVDAVLKVLLRYGNIRRAKGGCYELIKPYFRSESTSSIAFEPIVYFLADASTTLRRIIDRAHYSSVPRPFWRKVEAVNLSKAAAQKFATFARERTLTYLEELDDWLAANKTKGMKSTRKRRVGVGVFSIYSDFEIDNPAI
jgi:hypothetical protein